MIIPDIYHACLDHDSRPDSSMTEISHDTGMIIFRCVVIKWGGAAYINTTLPFGLCSAPKLFTAMVDGLAWCMMCEGVSDFLPYLVDFFCPQQSDSCGQSLQVAVELCEHLEFWWPPTK